MSDLEKMMSDARSLLIDIVMTKVKGSQDGLVEYCRYEDQGGDVVWVVRADGKTLSLGTNNTTIDSLAPSGEPPMVSIARKGRACPVVDIGDLPLEDLAGLTQAGDLQVYSQAARYPEIKEWASQAISMKPKLF